MPGGLVSIGKVDDSAYYEDYAKTANSPGRWYGKGCEQMFGIEPGTLLNIPAEGERGELMLALDGINPITKNPLEVPKNRSVKGYDITFSPPKTLSILASLAPDNSLRDQLWQAHRQAVDATLAWMERELMVGRRGHAGRDGTVHQTITAAQFDHETSRSDDPQIHTHCVVVGFGLGEDNRLSTLWSTPFWSGKAGREQIVSTLGEIYGAHLRRSTANLDLPIRWQKRTQRGQIGWEIAGITPKIHKEFSRRNAVIEHQLEALGLGTNASHAARQAVTMSTRQSKTERLAHELRPEWIARLEALRMTPEKLMDKVRDEWKKRKNVSSNIATDAVLDALEEAAPTFTKHDLVGAICSAAPAGLSIDQAEQLADTMLASGEIVRVAHTLASENMSLGYSDRFITKELWEREQAVLALARRTQHAPADGVVANRNLADDTIAANPGLDEEQQNVLKHMLMGGNVTIVEAGPGTGKTYVLGKAAQAWRAQRVPVIGLSVAWRAANEMRGVGIDSMALAAWKVENHTIPPGAVVVIDEASMISTSDLADLIEDADRVNARVILIGDSRQLGAVEAGGLFPILSQELGAATMITNRRQVASWERQMLADLRRGDAVRAVSSLAEHGRVVLSPTPEGATTRLLSDWQAARAVGEEVAILSATREGRDSLNALAHGALAASGVVAGTGVTVPSSDKHDGIVEREYLPGEQIRCLKKQSWKGNITTYNGTEATYITSHRYRHTLRLTDGREITVTNNYLIDHTDYAYASTIHSSQGRTVGTAARARREDTESTAGRCFVLAPEALALESAHVALSRATDQTTLYSYMSSEDADDSHLLDSAGNPITEGRDVQKIMTKAWSESGEAQAGAGEQRSNERVWEMVRSSTRTELEVSRDALARQLKASLITRDTLADARQQVAEASTPTEQAKAQEHRRALVVSAWQARHGKRIDLVDARQSLAEIDQAVSLQRKLEVRNLILAPAHPATEIVGNLPTGMRDQLLMEQALGELVDAHHYIRQARLNSNSERIQTMAEDKKVWADIAHLVQPGSDTRSLEELVDPSAATKIEDELVAHDIDPALLIEPAIERQVAALAWLQAGDREIGTACQRASEMAGAGVPETAALAVALRETGARLASRKENVPVAVRAATTQGVTIPATNALAAAAELVNELHPVTAEEEPETEPEVPMPTVPMPEIGQELRIERSI